MAGVALSRRAVKDVRRIGPGDELNRIREGLEALERHRTDPDIKQLRGRSSWLRLRVGDYRALYRPIASGEAGRASHLVARIVHRSDLQRAVATLA